MKVNNVLDTLFTTHSHSADGCHQYKVGFDNLKINIFQKSWMALVGKALTLLDRVKLHAILQRWLWP